MARCYIALGSNIGDRERYLRDARALMHAHHAITVLTASAVYETPALLPADALPEWNIAFLNQVVAIDTSLAPLALLEVMKGIEMHLGRQARGHWGPREIDCDILLYGDVTVAHERLQVPHPRMQERLFVMRPLADIAADIHVAGCSAQEWCERLSAHETITRYQKPKPGIMGIVNITPDSFSDGGAYATTERALRQVDALVAAGADVIDIGAESTRLGAEPLTHAQEWQRLEPVLLAIRKAGKRHWCLSVDTYHPRTATRAIAYGADWINDVLGLNDEAMISAVRDSEASLVVMHSLGVPIDPARCLDSDIPAARIMVSWAYARVRALEEAGIARGRIILDPGLGFGKTAQQSLALVQEAPMLVDAIDGVRWLFGHSRKSFMRLFGAEQPLARDGLTLAFSAYLAHAGVHYLRVHDVAAHTRLLREAV